jgi:hypothetical protein
MDDNHNSNIRLLYREKLIQLIMQRTYSRREYAEQLTNEIIEICTKTD